MPIILDKEGKVRRYNRALLLKPIVDDKGSSTAAFDDKFDKKSIACRSASVLRFATGCRS